MRFGKLLLISIFIIALLSTSSLSTIVTTDPDESKIGNSSLNWSKDQNHTFKYFNPSLGRLVGVSFIVTLNGSMYGMTENRNPNSSVKNSSFEGGANL
ncbi:MAG: choice-of-anchor E domain-containing protein [Methanothrix sp.]